MKSKYFAIPLAALMASGCSNIKSVSPEEANQVIATLQGPGNPAPAKRIEWIQPINKKESCKIYFEGNASEVAVIEKAYWDGNCKDGYAYGLGREFLIRDVDTGSWISTYPGGQNKPTYHSVSNYTSQSFGYGDPEKGMSGVGKIGNATTGENYNQILTIQSGGDVYFKNFSVASGEISYGKLYASGYAIGVQTQTNPASPVLSISGIKKGGQFYGYGIATYRNGVVEHKKVEPQGIVPAKLPGSYLAFLNNLGSEITAKLAAAEQNANESYRKVEAYKQKFCAAPKSNFEEPAHYRDICQEQGDVTAIYGRMMALSGERNARFERSVESQRQMAVQAAQIQAINNQTEAINHQTLTNSLNNLNNTIQQNNQRLQQNTYLNPVTPNFGIKPTYQTNCYNFGAVTRCNTQ